MSNILKLSNNVKVGKDNLQIVVESGSIKLTSDLNCGSTTQLTTLSHKSSQYQIGTAEGNYINCPPLFVFVAKDSNILMVQNNNTTTKLNANVWITYSITYYAKD